MRLNTLKLIDRLADELVTVVAIGGVVLVVTNVPGADPSVAIGSVAGLGGYRLARGRSGSGEAGE